MKALTVIGALTIMTSALIIFVPEEAEDTIVEPVQRRVTAERTSSTADAAVPSTTSPPAMSSDDIAERDPDAINVQSNPFNQTINPPTPKVTAPPAPPPVAKEAPAVPAVPFIYLGRFIENTDYAAIIQSGERVVFVKLGEEISGFEIERINEQGLNLVHRATGQRTTTLTRPSR